MLKVVDALPENHRATAADAARRLLIDPETDLLERRIITDELPDDVVGEVRRAVVAGHKLRIHYAAADQAPTWRTLDPVAMGFVAARTTVIRAGLLGVLTTAILLVAFYGVSPFDTATGGFAVDTDSIFLEYGPIGLITGFLTAATARWLAPKAATAPGRWAMLCCSVLTLALAASWAVVGWGAKEVVTSSGC